MSPGPALIGLHGICRRFGRVRALWRLDLDVAAGEFVALLGANGAGKSTLLRVVAGLARPSAGRLLLAGRPAAADPLGHRRRIGYVGHQTLLYDSLSPRENLALAGRLHAVAQLRTRVDQLLRAMELEHRADDPVGHLSRGMQQRVAIARALVHDPEILLLDEPMAGLDGRATAIVQALLEVLHRRGRTVLMVTHDFEQGLAQAGRVVMLHAGAVAADRPAAGLDGSALSGLQAALLEPARRPAAAWAAS